MSIVSKSIIVFLLTVTVTLSVFAVDSGQVRYVGGTVSGVKEDSIGKLDLVSDKTLTFDSPTGKLVIPYAAIESYEYSKEVTYHLGVAPAIAIALVKRRKRQHFLRITFRDGDKLPRVAVFEVPKEMPQVLVPALQSRAPQGCKAANYARCGRASAY